IRLDIVERQGTNLVVVATSSTTRDILARTFREAPTTQIRQIGDQRVMITSQALANSNYGVVAVASMENIDKYANFNRRGIPVFATMLIIVVITLMHFMFKRIVSKRLDDLLDGIRRAKAGEAARIPETRQDEIGVVAKTLNGLIMQAQLF